MSNCSFNYLGTHVESCIYFFVLQNKILNETDDKQSNKKKIHQIALNIRNLAFLCFRVWSVFFSDWNWEVAQSFI